jgi:tRNA1(Val) A37 N6-methylase TrmN6
LSELPSLDFGGPFESNRSCASRAKIGLKIKTKKAKLGQFMTPPAIAKFMAEMFDGPMPPDIRLLDAGAGQGALTRAFIAQWTKTGISKIDAQLYEYDPIMLAYLESTVHALNETLCAAISVFEGDFIEAAVKMIRFQSGKRFTHAILNPPYGKINSQSRHRDLLRTAGLETVNLYTGFVGVALELLEPGGELVAIIPRSFCNGPYYKAFRAFMLRRAAIKRIHLFGSRKQAFKQDSVLQENVIIALERGGVQGDITISTSTDDRFDDFAEQRFCPEDIVSANDPEIFIHIPTEDLGAEFRESSKFCFNLADLGINVSTGPVVDFRLRDYLCSMPEPGTVPLLYPGHFSANGILWPIADFKKPNAMRRNSDTEKWFYPNGFYTVVRRFSAKEEKRRIVSTIINPDNLPGDVIGLENHLNIFHQNKRPLPEYVARGLSIFLNSSSIDKYFRRFNGHTQVNATDLRLMKYPSLETLSDLGKWGKETAALTQIMIDEKIMSIS